MSSPRVAVVIPSNRPECLDAWLSAWAPYLDAVQLVVVEDEAPTWQTIRDELGKDAWIIPRQTDCVRLWGYLKAIRAGAEIIITMDDDCFPEFPHNGIAEHVRALDTWIDAPGWGRTLPDLRTRGIPVGGHVVVNHGLWLKVPDLDAELQLAGPPMPPRERYPLEQFLNVGTMYPLSGMNLSWHAYWTPVMYFGLMGRHIETGVPWGPDRFGDIWAGIAAKRAADHLGATIRSGTPFVRHDRASDPQVNLGKEELGKRLTPVFAHAIQTARLNATTIDEAAAQMVDAVDALDGDYWSRYAEAWHRWITLTSSRSRMPTQPKDTLDG